MAYPLIAVSMLAEKAGGVVQSLYFPPPPLQILALWGTHQRKRLGHGFTPIGSLH